MLRLLDDSAMVHKLGRHFVVFRECFFQRSEADLDPFLFKNIRKAAFGQTAMEGHLSALEPDFHRVAGARLLSFFTTARSLAQARSRPAPETFFPVRRTLGRV